jgi:hypothetical protein
VPVGQRRWAPSWIWLDDPKSRAAAVLLRDEGLRLVGEIAGLIDLELKGGMTSIAEVQTLCDRLSVAGYRLRSDPDLGGFATRRWDHARCIEAIAGHLGTSLAPLIP